MKKVKSSTSHSVITTYDPKDIQEWEPVWRRLAGSYCSEYERDVDDIDFKLNNISELSKEFSLCVTGAGLDLLSRKYFAEHDNVLRSFCPHVTVFARVSPFQKESIVFL